jgi:acetyltransferase
MSAYPAELEENVRLADGLEVFLRPIRPDDGELLRNLVANMSPEDRRLRFFIPLRQLSPELVWSLSHVDYQHDIALLALAADSGSILGVVRLAGDDRGAEFAIALRRDLKGHGLGWLLMHRMLDLAARLGVAEVHGVVLRENRRMLKMCREMGFAIEPEPADPAATAVRRIVTPQDAPSLPPPAGKGMGNEGPSAAARTPPV